MGVLNLTIRTISNAKFAVEIDALETIGDLKAKIQVANGSEPSRQKLIHAGRVLGDDSLKLESTPISDGDFIVLMLIKPPAASTSPKTPSTANQAPSTSTSNNNNKAEETLVTGDAYEETVKQLTDMGFEKSQVVLAMRAAFNNPERATEYLTSGNIPIVEDAEMPASSGMMEEDEDEAALYEDHGDDVETEEGGEQGAHHSSLAFLANDPQFQQLRLLIMQNPSMLGPIIQELAHSSPELLQLVQEHREELEALLLGDFQESSTLAAGNSQDADSSGEQQVIEITEEEKAAIDRLGSMGFDRARVIEAYFACDKNEELAANYLLNHLDED